MPDTPHHDDRVERYRSDLPPPGPLPGDAAERFAEALDALVLGAPVPEIDDVNDPSLVRLTVTARRIQRRHGSRMTASGPQSATPIGQARKRQIWAELMAQHAHAPDRATVPTAPAPNVGRIAALMQPWVAIDDERPARSRRATAGPLRFVPDLQPATTFTLVIAVLIAISAAFSTIVDPGNPGVTPTVSAEGIASIAGQASPATPDGATAAVTTAIPPTADMLDQFHQPIPTGVQGCTVEPRPSSQIAALFRDPGPVTPRAYLPATTPDRLTAQQVAMAGRTYLACEWAGPVNTDRALQTGRFIYEEPTNGHFRATGGATDLATREEQQQLVTLALGADYHSKLFLVSDRAVSQEKYEAAVATSAPLGVSSALAGTPEIVLPEQLDATFLPVHAVQLADGRVAIPEIRLVNPTDVDAWVAAGDDINPDIVTFFIFGPEPTGGDQWMLDERLYVCPDSDLCADYYAWVDQYDQASNALFPSPATPPTGSPQPTSTPTSEAAADDSNLIYPLPGPGTSGNPATEVAALPTADLASASGNGFQRPVPAGDDACPVEPRPIEAVAAFLRDPGPVTPRAYLPATTPDPAVAEEVARAGRMYLACQYAEPVDANRALQTPRFIYEDRANAYFREAGGARDIATAEEREQLASQVLGENPGSSQTILTEQAISRVEYEEAAAAGAPPETQPEDLAGTPTVVLPEQVDSTFIPEQAVQLADGRIAIPGTYLLDPADIDAWLSTDPVDAFPNVVWFDIFARDTTRDGQWALDERLPVCLGNGQCDDFYDDTALAGDALFPAPATPPATPDIATAPATAPPRATPTARTSLGRGR